MHKTELVVKVEDIIKKAENGTTIKEICNALKLSRNTVIIELARLEGAEKVCFRKVGNVKLYTKKGDKK